MPTYRLAQTMDRSQLIARYPRPTRETLQQFISHLRDTVEKSLVVDDPDQLLAYSYDATGERHWPNVVVLPQSITDVQLTMRLAHTYGIPIIGRGASTNLSGGTTPLVGGVVISLARMNRILGANWDEGWVRVEPGVVNADLQTYLQKHGFFYPPDPSSHRISTIGGNIAENSGGPHCVKYGVTTHHTLSMQAVLVDGTLVSFPRVGDTQSGLDLSSVVIGSEGTLAVIVEASLAILPVPASKKTLLASFLSVDHATRAVSAIVASRVTPAALELMDRRSIEIIEPFVHAGYPVEAGAVLLIELDGAPAEVAAHTQKIKELCEREHAISFQMAHDDQQAEAFWRGRRAHYGASARLAPHLWVQDVTVPRPQLATMMDRVLQIAEEQQLLIVTAAHAGDGNLHPSIPYDPQDPDQVRRLKAADHAILSACVELGGAITGEHGIGIDKAEHLPLMYSPDELTVMNDLKRAFDPSNLLNPFKALWEAGPSDPPQAPQVDPGLEPTSPLALVEAVRFLVHEEQSFAIRGESRRAMAEGVILTTSGVNQVIDFDPDNLSIEVGSGMRASLLWRVLRDKGLDLPGLEPFLDDTIGGLVATNATYWRDTRGRGWRDKLLAARWIDGQGRVLKFGRKTMKNVAGYDISKLLVGSQGRLGVMAQLTLRVEPQPDWMRVGESQPLQWDEALHAVHRMVKLSDGPPGLFLESTKVPGLVRLTVVQSHASSSNLSALVSGGLRWGDGEDAWLAKEKERQAEIYEAIRAGTYHWGVSPLGREEDVKTLFAGHQRTRWSPLNGRWEALGGPIPGIQSGQDRALHEIEQRIIRIFDPKGYIRA